VHQLHLRYSVIIYIHSPSYYVLIGHGGTREIQDTYINILSRCTRGHSRYNEEILTKYEIIQYSSPSLFSVYDVSNRETFEQLNNWLVELSTYCPRTDIIKIIVGNKVDQVNIINHRRLFRASSGYT